MPRKELKSICHDIKIAIQHLNELQDVLRGDYFRAAMTQERRYFLDRSLELLRRSYRSLEAQNMPEVPGGEESK